MSSSRGESLNLELKPRRSLGAFFGVPSMIDSLEVEVLYPA
jgi:hypothetical protein